VVGEDWKDHRIDSRRPPAETGDPEQNWKTRRWWRSLKQIRDERHMALLVNVACQRRAAIE
jgi:hypothetical protein